MIIRKDQRKRIKCEVCKNVKNANLIHAKKNWRKVMKGKLPSEVDTFVLQYRIRKHRHGDRLCKGSDKVQSREYDGTINSSF